MEQEKLNSTGLLCDVLNLENMQENYFLQTSNLIRCIVNSKLNYYYHQSFVYHDAAEDITQKVLLKLWKWKIKRIDRHLTELEWFKLANTSAQNEVKRFQAQNFTRNRQLSINHVADEFELHNTHLLSPAQIEGNTNFETLTLVLKFWQAIKKLSKRQKYAILLTNTELISQLIVTNCCKLQDISNCIDLTKEELAQVIKELPLSDDRICQVYERVYTQKIVPKQIWEARFKARKKLSKIILPNY